MYSLVTKYTSNNSILPVHNSTEVQHIIEDRTGNDKQHDLVLQKPRTQVTAQKLTKLQLLLMKKNGKNTIAEEVSDVTIILAEEASEAVREK